MRVVLDLEANSLKNPTHIWCIVCKDIDTGEVTIFRKVTEDETVQRRLKGFLQRCTYIVGHNWLGYDLPCLVRLLGFEFPIEADKSIDTLVVSKLVDYSREGGHSIEQYGIEFDLNKIPFNNFTEWSQEMEDYCVRDVEITALVYNKFLNIIHDPQWFDAINLEQRFQYLVVNRLHDNGFAFDLSRSLKYLTQVEQELSVLDKEIKDAFPPRLNSLREVTPVYTKFGTLHRKDFRWIKDGNLSEFNGGPFCRCEWQEFNPASHKQIIDVLHHAGWRPADKTKTHLECERTLNRLKYTREDLRTVDTETISVKLVSLKKYGWKINENNLTTLPPGAPTPARLLAKRILLESRRRTLVEWRGLTSDDGRIRGKFIGIGAWTGRMSHQEPNTANIPLEYKQTGEKVFLGKEMRALWIAPKKRLLIGVDADTIQFRIFAHYVNSKELIDAIVNGRKSDGTDAHSFNQRVLGRVCASRQTAKRLIYALFFGAGIGKVSEILECTRPEAEEAMARILQQYPGFALLKSVLIPEDARKGWFRGLDGRKVQIPGDTVGQRKHLCMSGYLQNGEAIVMKRASLKWIEKLNNFNSKLVNFVHDEWQTEVPNNIDIALQVAQLQADSLREVGEELKLNCPLAGSFFNEDKKDYTIGTNWSVTH